MAPRRKTSTLPPTQPTPRERDSSPELVGSPSRLTRYNKDTGRPIRKSAGKASKPRDYIDSGILDNDDFLASTTEDSDTEQDMGPRRSSARLKRNLKRKRSPSPPSPHLDPIQHSQELDEMTDDDVAGSFHRHTPKKPPITLQFNVPLGFHGPLFVKLDKNLLRTEDQGTLHEMQQLGTPENKTINSTPARPATQKPRKSFTDLPPELRNKIYRQAFVRTDGELKIPPAKDGLGLCRSAQFLRTCKLVHDEGCSILYGENKFLFARHFFTRGPFWEARPKEIGYQDVLQFLKMIGPENVQYLRDIKFKFDDACPRDTPYVDSNEKRRYLNDDYLMSCLRILRQAKLRSFQLRFLGRRAIVKSDVKFLGYLEQIKADEVSQFLDGWIYPPQKISDSLWEDLQELMVRKKKLYDKK